MTSSIPVKLVIYASSSLVPFNGKSFSDARVPRGAILAFTEAELGASVMHHISNHGSALRSPIAFSMSSNNPRRMYVTLLAPHDDVAKTWLRDLSILLPGRILTIGNGGLGSHNVTILEAHLIAWKCRGTYKNVAAYGAAEAMAMVPGAQRVTQAPGRAGRRADRLPFDVTTQSGQNPPLQAGKLGSYGYGVLV